MCVGGEWAGQQCDRWWPGSVQMSVGEKFSGVGWLEAVYKCCDEMGTLLWAPPPSLSPTPWETGVLSNGEKKGREESRGW